MPAEDPSRLRQAKTRLAWTIIPRWLVVPFTILGMIFVVIYPLALTHVLGRTLAWYLYGASLFSCAYTAYTTRRKYRLTVIERSEHGVIYRVRRLRSDEDVPKVPARPKES